MSSQAAGEAARTAKRSAPGAETRHDETRDARGAPLPGFARVLERLGALDAERRRLRQREIERLLDANGAAYSPLAATGETESRPWRLDLVPLVIEPDDWRGLCEGLVQRARLKRAILADIYGEQRLLAERVVPPAAVYAHRGYLRDARFVAASARLPLYGADVSRSPNGKWYVADDVCQYPAGIGYALENRLVLSRVLPALFRDLRVARLVGYFRALQQRVIDAMDRDARCVLLGHGAAHPYHFEFAWLAKYLGYTLVEHEDLMVRAERVFLRTVAGLQRVDVILRFVEDGSADPLAVDARGRGGVPGLLDAVRARTVEIINPLGSAVLDNPALEPFLPALCEALLGEPLALPGAPTYWLGDPVQRERVLARTDELLFREIDAGGRLHDPRRMTGDERATLERQIARLPERLVAQERLDRSLAPGYEGDVEVRRQLTLRSYLVEAGEGYSILPGGLCLLDEAGDGRRPAFESLSGSKDVWVRSEAPVAPDTLLPSPDDAFDYAVIEGELPSRVAENLFWLGRNAERAEMTLRALRAVCRALQTDDTPLDDALEAAVVRALLRTATAVTGSWPGFLGKGARRRLAAPGREIVSLMHDGRRSGSLVETLARLQSSAARVPDRMSPEVLRVLVEIREREATLHRAARPRAFPDDAEALIATIDALDALVVSLAAFAGLAHENFTHGDGWRFMMLGRRIERARQTATVARTMLGTASDDEALLEALLRLLDSIMTYRSRYRTRLDPRLVLQLVALDETNPRAVAFQLGEIDALIGSLPGRRPRGLPDPLARAATAGLSRVRLADAETLLGEGPRGRQHLGKFLGILEAVCDELSTRLTHHYFAHTELRRAVGLSGQVDDVEELP